MESQEKELEEARKKEAAEKEELKPAAAVEIVREPPAEAPVKTNVESGISSKDGNDRGETEHLSDKETEDLIRTRVSPNILVLLL